MSQMTFRTPSCRNIMKNTGSRRFHALENSGSSPNHEHSSFAMCVQVVRAYLPLQNPSRCYVGTSWKSQSLLKLFRTKEDKGTVRNNLFIICAWPFMDPGVPLQAFEKRNPLKPANGRTMKAREKQQTQYDFPWFTNH